ncbi:MAG TPA: M20 family metallopeptidase [Bryobacteraceae bacterium]|nr:M20 family metallopeptidase [Bryobacteraceae bacterium]
MESTFSLEQISAVVPRIMEWRHSLHRIPEIGNDLPKTLAYVEAALVETGATPRRCGKGLIADFGKSGPLVAIRADMDGLPVEEATGLPYASVHRGNMHACGHDVHTACLLGCAAILRDVEPGFRVRLIFQPGEEGYFGALGMINDGCLNGVGAIVAGHVGDLTEELGPGDIGVIPGAMMAASDGFEGAFVGVGGHGSAPHRVRDPTPALAEFVLQCHAFRSREFDQTDPAVVSVCMVSAGSAHNVIPECAVFKGTVRTLSVENRALAERRLREIGEGIALANNLRFTFDWRGGYPPLVNDDRVVNIVRTTARNMVGQDKVITLKRPNMGGEDFAYYLQRVPGCFWFVNTQNSAKGITAANHNPRFDVDEERLAILPLLNLNAAAALARSIQQDEL